MHIKKLTYALLTSTLLLMSEAVFAETGSLQTCQSIRDKITYYTDLRRNGGSSSQMSLWKKRKHEYRKKFSKYNCRNHGSKIKS